MGQNTSSSQMGEVLVAKLGRVRARSKRRPPIKSISRKPEASDRNRPYTMGSLIHDVSRLRRTYLDNVLKPLGLTASQCWVLVVLSRQGDAGLTQSALAKRMHLGKVTLGGLIDRLESGGCVVRQFDPQDRRIRCVALTAVARSLVTKIEEVIASVNARILRGMRRTDVLLMEDTLYRMKTQLIAMDAVPGVRGNRSVAEDV
jgi:MarR family transcriptional regulator for hemolysin